MTTLNDSPEGSKRPSTTLCLRKFRRLTQTRDPSSPPRPGSATHHDPSTLVRYTELTGYTPTAAALTLYRLRWSLVDIAEFVTWFRTPHAQTPDTQAAWQAFNETLTSLAKD